MRPVSDAYNPFPTVRATDAVVSFEVAPVTDAKTGATVETAWPARIGTIRNTMNGVEDLMRKYGTLEQYGWPLDGSCYMMPNSGAEIGWWSQEVSRSDGTFSSPITVRADLSEPIDTMGWTFHFDGPGRIAASRVEVIWYDANDQEMGRASDTPNGEDDIFYGWSIRQTASNYAAVEFKFYGTNEPFRMLRIIEIDFGISWRFTKDSLQSLTIKYGLEVDAAKVPAKEMTFVMDNSDGRMNILSPSGIYQYWLLGQVMRAKIRVGDDIVNMGTFAQAIPEIVSNRLLLKIRAHDQCYYLARQKYIPGEDIRTAESLTLQEAAEDVLAGYDLKIDYNGLEDEPVSLAVNEDHYKRQILAYIAQAARCSVWIDRNNTVQFRRLAVKTREEADGYLTGDELYDWAGVSVVEEITGVSLTVKHELEVGQHGGQGVTYRYTSGVADDEGTNTVSYTNPCVAPGQEQDVCDWLLTAANWRRQYAVKNRCDPAIELGDTVVIEDAFRYNGAALVTGVEIHYNGTLWAVTNAAAVIDE